MIVSVEVQKLVPLPKKRFGIASLNNTLIKIATLKYVMTVSAKQKWGSNILRCTYIITDKS